MPEAKPKKKNVFQKLAAIARDFEEWIEETFGDAELAAEIKADLGLDPTNPATPTPADPDRRNRLKAFEEKQDIDEAALGEVIADIKATVDTVMTFIDAAKADGMDAVNLFWSIFKVFSVEVLRVRNPAGYALVRVAGLMTEDDETMRALDADAVLPLVRGEGTKVDGEKWVQRLSMVGGVTVVMLANFVDALDGAIDAMYGWDPDPEDLGETAAIASRALTVTLDHDVLGGARPAITLIGVPTGHGGPGLFASVSAGFQFPMDVGDTTYLTDITGAGQFGMFIPFSTGDVRYFAGFTPAVRITAEPRRGSSQPENAPALVVGTTDATRLQIGALAFGIEVTADRAAFRLAVRKGKLVIALGTADAFLRQLPGGNVEIPFEIAMVVDTASGLRFEGGTGLKVNLPVSASLFGVFTIQFLELELVLEPSISIELRGGFSLKLGPFAASVDRAGMAIDLAAISRTSFDELVSFAPPKGIGLVLDAGVVKGGGYLFIDSQRGEYAGALELKFLTFSIKAIGLLSTKRPDGREGWSLLLFVFGQFNIHIAFGIFWTGLGGMIGLHHRADVDALSAGMRTGALDDILFPDNPVADAPRIINRYRTLFPIEDDNFLIGPMLELSFSQPPVVYARLGLIFDVRNALGPGSASLSKVVIVGQLLVQLPPRDTEVPAILKLLVDVVGFYDTDTQFLLIRARLRDSFVGIEGVAKIELAGELLLAVQFGAHPNFVLSAGGFHPKYEGLPERVPRQLDRLRASFGIKVVKLSVEQYFAVTPNSVQAGQRASLKADFGVASIEASLSWDALLYLSPRFYFVVDLEFRAKVKAFGETLASVGVTATLEGPDQWHIKGEFSFSILWWDKSVSFEERWGEVETADAGTASLAAALTAELANPDNVVAEGPVGGAGLVTLAPPGGATGNRAPAHPLGRVAVRQGAVPLGLEIDRLGTRRIEGGPTTVHIDVVTLNDEVQPTFESTSQPFARGQFAPLTDEARLTGKVFEPFPCGVVVGAADYVTPDGLARDVTATFETVRLDPEPQGVLSKWSLIRLTAMTPSFASMVDAARYGAAARSERAVHQRRGVSALGGSTVSVGEPPMALVDPDRLTEAATLLGPATASPSLAAQAAAVGGLRVLEAFEVVP